jgi:flagellar hook-associated protein 2
MGFTGVGITTTGITGSATLDSVAMIADVTNNIFSISSGLAAGLKVGYSGLGASTSVYYGQSLLDKFTSYISTALSSTAAGSVASRVTSLNTQLISQNDLLADLNTKFEVTRSRYIQQFSAMESAVTSLKSTGEYLTNLFESMNSDN